MLCLLLLSSIFIIGVAAKDCTDDEALVRVETRTDIRPSETRWEIEDVSSSNSVLFSEGSSFVRLNQLYTNEYCLTKKDGCYKFTIYDEAGNGICCASGNGSYRVYYDDDLIKEGGEFESSDSSPLFGDNCPTSKPSMSLEPTSIPSILPSNGPTLIPSTQPSNGPTLIPSTKPSITTRPSAQPSISLKPSLSLSPSSEPTSIPSTQPTITTRPSEEPTKNPSEEPSFEPSQNPSISPTNSAAPTNTPTDEEDRPPAEFSTDNLGRRRFPPQNIRPNEGSFAFQPFPNCDIAESSGRIGCVGFPNPVIPSKLDWAGKLHKTQTSCSANKYGGQKKCDLNIPISRQVSPLLLSQTTSGFDDMSNNKLPLEEKDIRPTFTVAVGDLDNDGYIDVVEGNVNQKNQILYGKGNGTFHDPVDLPGGSNFTNTIHVVDLDGDDLYDIVCTSLSDSSHILWNEGGRGNFSEMVLPENMNGKARNVGFWDFDGNGELDIVVAMDSEKNVLLYNEGDRKFSSRNLTLPGIASAWTAGLALGDVDDNGTIDIIIANIYHKNELLLNNGDGTFTQQILPGEDRISRKASLADIDSDGHLDIIFSNGFVVEPMANQILWNIGDGNFDVEDLPGGEQSSPVVNIGDIDGDGRLDLVVINNENPHFLLNYVGDRQFRLMNLPFVGPNPATAVLADLDGNGLLDIVISITALEEPNQVLMNYVDGRSPSQISRGFMPIDLALQITDTIALVRGVIGNNDIFVDTVFANVRSSNQIILTTPNGTKTTDIPVNGREITCMISMHYNEDKFVDLFVGNLNGPNQIIINRGVTEQTDFIYEVIDIPNSNSETLAAATADLNNDGFMDLVIGNRNGPNQILLNADGNGTFIASDLTGTDAEDTTSIGLGDIDGDGWIDLIFGNGETQIQPNYILYNNAESGTFKKEELPGKPTKTHAIAVGNLYNNERLDILVGNHNGPNYILYNNGSGFEQKELPGDSVFTNSIALGDMDEDGDLDIVLGNGYLDDRESNEILVNIGNGYFIDTIIPNTLTDTRAVSISDLDGNGILDMAFGNYRAANNFFLKSVCTRGAQLHSQSWCFSCPNFMGTQYFFGERQSLCQECLPDHMQSDFGETCALNPCLNGERPLGNDECSRCPDGTFYNSAIVRDAFSPESWNAPRCIECDPGQFSDWKYPAIDTCSPCASGSSQKNTGATDCPTCDPGTFQPLRGQATCVECEVGGYCNGARDTCGGGWTACKPGTYNNKRAQTDESNCILCDVGTFSTETGANSSNTCGKCLPGSFSNNRGETNCTRCEAGTYQSAEGSISCIPCEAGTYADAEGLAKCSKCPERLNSTDGSESCIFCGEGFYLNDFSVDPSVIFSSPSSHCFECPENADCATNTTLKTLVVHEGYWRDSLDTSKLYRCHNSVCSGSPVLGARSNQIQTGYYCKGGHKGPRCEVCVEKNQYFKAYDKCEDCPSLWLLMIPFSIAIVILIAIFLVKAAISRSEAFRRRASQLTNIIPLLSLQAKFKIFLSFYQVISTLEPIYGVQFDDECKAWFDIMQFFKFNLFGSIRMPSQCLGSMNFRVSLGACWPFLLLVVYFSGIMVYTLFAKKKKLFGRKTWQHFLNVTIIVLYVTLPSVCNMIFDARKCVSFDNNDTGSSSSYLIADLDIRCSSDDTKYSSLQRSFWVFFVLWPIMVPLAFLVLLWYIRGSLRTKRITSMAEGCRFLWKDYDHRVFYWDIVDVLRKISLTGFISFADPEEGSRKITRLIIATMISMVYLCILLLVRPYGRTDDFYLAAIGNLLLGCCFVLGIILQICSDDSEDGACERHIGMSLNSLRATIFAVGLMVAMLIITIIFLCINAANAVQSLSLKLVSTGLVPNWELDNDCNFHIFISHIWNTGQAKAHVMARSMQILNKHMKIWLDVDELNSIGDLEESVSESAVFILFYTEGYFRSTNCRREVYAAVDSDKPMILIYEDSPGILDEIHEECSSYCGADNDPDKIISQLFRKKPVMWLGSSVQDFAIESIKLISLHILEELPYYKKHPYYLNGGLTTVNELGTVELNSFTNIIVSNANNGAYSVAEKVIESLGTSSKNQLHIVNVTSHEELVIDLNGPSYLLLYLNEDTFVNKEAMSDIVKGVFDLGMKVILVSEKDSKKKACKFSTLRGTTPQDLMDKPYSIYNTNLSIPLYPEEEYLKIGLRQILLKMEGASEKGVKLSFWKKLKSLRMRRERMEHQGSSILSIGSVFAMKREDSSKNQARFASNEHFSTSLRKLTDNESIVEPR